MKLSSSIILTKALPVTLLYCGCLPLNELNQYRKATGGESNVGTDDAPSSLREDAGAAPLPQDSLDASASAQPDESGLVSLGSLDAGTRARADASGMPLPMEADSSVPPAVAVVNTVPLGGELGVAPDTEFMVKFDRPMDTAATESAFESESLPSNAVTFRWTDGDTILHVQPSALLEIASGTDPAVVVARNYDFGFAPGARSAAGAELPALRIDFQTLRQISQALPLLVGLDDTGNFRSDNDYGNGDCAAGSDFICVGDRGNGNSQYKGFLSFDPSSLAVGELQLLGAQLSLSPSTPRGTPFAALLSFRVEAVNFAIINLVAFDVEAASAAITLATETFAPGSFDVSAATLLPIAGIIPRTPVQYRLFFERPTDADDSADRLQLVRSVSSLALTYLVP